MKGPQQVPLVGVCGHEISGSAKQRIKLRALPSKKSRILGRSSSPAGNGGGNLIRHFGEDLKIP